MGGIAKSKFHQPVPPGQKAFIRVLEIRLGILDDASQRLENFTLRLHRILDFGFPGQPEILEHGHPHAFEISGAEGLTPGKTFSVTGWKVGWACATPELLGAVKTAKQFLTYVNAGPFDLIAEGLTRCTDYVQHIAGELREKHDLFSAGLAKIGFGVFEPHPDALCDVGRRATWTRRRSRVLLGTARALRGGRYPAVDLL